MDVDGVRERRGCFTGVGSAAVDDALVDLGHKGNGEGVRGCAWAPENEREARWGLGVRDITGRAEVRRRCGGAPAKNFCGLGAWGGAGLASAYTGKVGAPCIVQWNMTPSGALRQST